MMSTDPFSRVPPETTQAIASQYSFNDILSLGRTSRRFYEICSDLIVPQQCFFNEMGNQPPEPFLTGRLWSN